MSAAFIRQKPLSVKQSISLFDSSPVRTYARNGISGKQGSVIFLLCVYLMVSTLADEFIHSFAHSTHGSWRPTLCQGLS